MSSTRLNASPPPFSREKLVARDARVKDRQCTAELADFFRATAPTVLRSHLEDDEQLNKIATCVKCLGPMREGPNSWHRRQTLENRDMGPSQRCSTEATISTGTTSPAKVMSIKTTAASLKKMGNDLAAYPHLGKVLNSVSEKLRRAVSMVQEPPVSTNSEEIISLDSSVNPSNKTLNTHNHWMSRTANDTGSILHGAFDVPQQYYLRDKLELNGRKHMSPGEIGESDDDVSICSHTSTEYHHGSCRMLSLTRRYFTLDHAGQVRQYALTVSDKPNAEEVFQTNANSIVVATDAVPGHLWCLRLSNYDIHDANLQELPQMECKKSPRSKKAQSATTEDMLIVFNDPEKFATWMFAIKELVEEHRERSNFPHVRQRHTFSSISSSQDSDYSLETKDQRSSCDDEDAHPFATKLPGTHYPSITNVDPRASRCKATPKVHGRADRAVSVYGDKHKRIDISSIHTATESSTIEARFPTTSEDQDLCSTSLQHRQMQQRTSLKSAIRHSLFESPVKSQTTDLTGDYQRVNSDGIISHSLFERHPSIIEDENSRCCHLLSSADGKDLSVSDPMTLFELSPPLFGMNVPRPVCEHEIDLALCPTQAWTVDEEDLTHRTLTVASSCPPNSPRNSENSGELHSLAGVSTWDFPLPPICGQIGGGDPPKRTAPRPMSTFVRMSQEQASRASSRGYKKSPTRFATAEHSPGSPFSSPGRHVHPRRHTDSARMSNCLVLHVSLSIAPRG